MSLIDMLFGRRKRPTANSQPHSQLASAHSQQSKAATVANRREMLRVVLRDTLTRHGIPASWITGEMLVATSRTRQPGIHWRLVVKHWDPRLLTYGVAFQNHLIRRVMTFDPMAAEWLMGISWQYALDDESACPAMPQPGTWTADPHRHIGAAPVAVPAGGSGDVIAGPVLIGAKTPRAPAGSDQSSAREDLERLLAVRDADIEKHSQDFAATQTFEPTEPAKLSERGG